MHSYNHSAHWTPQTNRAQNQEQRHPTSSIYRHTTVQGPPYSSMHASASPAAHPSALHSVPAVLTPGRYRNRSLDTGSALLLHSSTPSYNLTSTLVPSPARTSFYGDYFYTQQYPTTPPPPLPVKPRSLAPPAPPIPPKPPIAPALPPKIPLYPQSIPGPVAGPSSRATQSPSPPVDEGDIALAMAVSASEARRREELMIAQEEEELAKALEESRLYTSTYSHRSSSPRSNDGSPSQSRRSSGPSHAQRLSPVVTPPHPPEGESWLHLVTPTGSINFEDEQAATDEPSSQEGPSRSDGASPTPAQDRSDTPTPNLPLYNEVVSKVLSNSRPSTLAGRSSASMTASLESSRSSESSRPPLRTMASYSSFRPRIPTPEPPVVLPRPHSSATVTSDGTSSARSSFAESSSRSPQNTPALPPTSANSAVSLDPLDEDAEEDYFTSNARPTPSLSANHYVEPDLLLGISLAFTPPAISTVLTQMSGSMPNLITLPYGKYPALHLQAPSWRQMLKLMARLSGTRIEPTLEAITVAKHELKLRIVVQFVKVHHSSSDWRTVLYLTTDYPCPPNTNNAHKYTNGDVSVLPYSYTLSSLPTLLRDGAESPMAKYYVIPSTNSTPYPTLPINFPNLAMYLQSAVQDSRKAANDSSSGLRKLANYIDTCYPNDSEPVNSLDDKEVTRRGVGGMFKRVIQVGRNKPVKGRGNEEIYELVTPFVPDEWG